MEMNINRMALVFVLMTVAIYQLWDKMPNEFWYVSIIGTIAIYMTVLHIMETRYRVIRSNIYERL